MMTLSHSLPANTKINQEHRPTQSLHRLAIFTLATFFFSLIFAQTVHAESAATVQPKTKVASKPVAKTSKSIEQRSIETVKKSFDAYVSEKTNSLLALYHPQSSLRQETAENVQVYFDENKLIGELVNTKYLSHDKEFSYVTAKVITRDIGPNIRLSKYERDILFILKPYGNRYLIWTFRTLDNPVLNETTF